jgi:hypothetical protein
MANNNPITQFFDELSNHKFFGSITLKFESGKLTHIKKEENLKPSELSGTPRPSHEQSTFAR